MPHEDKLIEYLSKEIEIQSSNIMTFRTRANLPVFLGPFVLLGSVVASKGVPSGITVNGWTYFYFAGLALSYVAMGVSAAGIESQIWNQCNKWRGLIANATSQSPVGVTKEDLKFDNKLNRGYLVVYLAMLGAFVFALLIVLRLQFPVLP
jgi:hypothetical protein